jgi:hypothetical protein
MIAISRLNHFVFGLSLALFVPVVRSQNGTTTYTGTIGVGCTDGTCTISGTCDEPVVPNGTDLGDGLYTDINGEVYVSPDTCVAECDDNCMPIPGSDSSNGCIGSAGYVYCPETQECIRPWLTNCPFNGTVWTGPITITVRTLPPEHDVLTL